MKNITSMSFPEGMALPLNGVPMIFIGTK